ncbi:MAG: single-stranded DNA-binding protein [Planctomycetaceae bacterium]|nr:single-stranded DNA-binding protein [Planctomycetaceae bacterium]
MPNLNRVLLMGNLTRDPELRYLPSNMPVVNLGIATNRRWRNQQGESQEETTFVDCEAYGRTAEVINQYLRKGRPIFIDGRLRLDQWQDREGQHRSKLKVIVESFEFVDSRSGPGDAHQGHDTGPNRSTYASPPPGPTPGSTHPQPHVTSPPHASGPAVDAHQPVSEEDIPF